MANAEDVHERAPRHNRLQAGVCLVSEPNVQICSALPWIPYDPC